MKPIETSPVSAFDPRAIFDAHVTDTGDLSDQAAYEQVRPDSLLADGDAYYAAVADRLLARASSEFDHHEELRRSMETWVTDLPDSAPDAYEQVVFNLTPHERNTGNVTGEGDEITRKVSTVAAWLAKELGSEVVNDIITEYHRALAEDWEQAISQFQRKMTGRTFLSTPPEELNGWEQIDAPGFTLAYYGVGKTVSEPRVVALFEMDGYVRLWEIHPDDWATDLRHRVGLDQSGIHQFRERSLGKPGPDSWVDGAVKLKQHLENHAGDSVSKPYLPTLDGAGLGGRGKLGADPDPEAVTPPAGWKLETYEPADSKGDVHSRVVAWEHPFYGRLVCKGTATTWNDTPRRFRTDIRLKSGVKPDANPLVERMDWSSAFDAAVEYLDTLPEPELAVSDAAEKIGGALDDAADDDSSVSWPEAEHQAAVTVRSLQQRGYGPETILTAVRAGNANGATGNSNLPTHRPLVHAGVEHPDMSQRARNQAAANAGKEIEAIEQAYQPGLHSYND